MNELERAREIINEVDKEMALLFEKRMLASELVAKYKKERGLSILDKTRENEVTCKNSEMIKNSVYQEYYADLSIFPNPATSVLYIQSGELPVGDAYIYNISGKLCKTVTLQGKEITEVEVADLPAGVYILRLGSQALRFIKK